MADDVKLAHPGALGLFGFGFNTILLQFHNCGWMGGSIPLWYGFVWGGAAQVIAGIIDARRGDTFGATAFTSYGLFWIGLALLFSQKQVVAENYTGIAYAMLLWGVFTGLMTIGTFKISRVHTFIFASLTVLFMLLAAHFSHSIDLSPKWAGYEGIVCGASAVYGATAVIMNAQYGKWILPMGFPKPAPTAKPAK